MTELSLSDIDSLVESSSEDPKAKAPGAKCSECPLVKRACVRSSGPQGAEVAVVSRSPTSYDSKAGKPMSGASGKVLDHLLNLYGHKREETFVTNVVLCECKGPPPKEAIKACKPRLDLEIAASRTVIAAGSEATTLLTRRKSMEGSRGYEHTRSTTHGTQRVIVSNNPALVLRDDSAFPNLVRDFRLALDPLPPPRLPTVDWTNDPNVARKWFKTITSQKHELLSIDIETRGIRADAPLVALGLSTTGDRAVSFGDEVCSDLDIYRSWIRPILSGRTQYLYHNGKFDTRNLRWHGVNARVDEDTMLLSWALDERSDEGQVHSLTYLLMNELNWPKYEPEVVVNWKSTVGRLEKQLRFKELYELPTPDELYEYNALDAAGTALLFPILRNRAIKDGVYDLYKNILIPASEALVLVELNGTHFNTHKALDILENEVWPKLNELKTELRSIVDDPNYNPNSAPQNAALVYDEWKILHNLPLKDERSVDKSVYTEIKNKRFTIAGFKNDNDPIPREKKEIAIKWATPFSDFKELDKQRSTYLEGLIPRAVHDNGKLFTSFKLHNTVSGRLSSSGPNLQNITRTKPWLPNIRALFDAPEGYTLVQADYSQAELRAIAAVSGDDKLSEVYREGRDLHNVVAGRFYGEDFTKEQRSRSKNMNFGVAYGQSAMTFQEKHGIPEKEADTFIKWWWREFTGVSKWAEGIAKQVTKEGVVISPLGYKRRFHLITKENRNASIREGINFIPQNIAGVFTIWAVTQLCNMLDPNEADVVLTVHDSIVLRVRNDCVDSVSDMVVRTMEEAPLKLLNWDFPFDADVQVGNDWGSLG